MPEKVLCQICSSKNSIFVQSSYVYLNSVELNLVKCKRCGLVYLDPQPIGIEIEKLYSEDYFIKWYVSERKREFSKNFFRSLCTQYELLDTPGKYLLDVGCGMGYFLEAAREWGFDVKGVEISSYAVRYCKEQLLLDVHCGALETANYQSNCFDIITAFDFLEHIGGLSSFLSEAKRVLKTKGVFVVLVPNYESFVFQLERMICRVKKIPLSNVPEHLSYFTVKTLSHLLQKNGFKVNRIFTTEANDEGEYLIIRGNPLEALRAALNNFCYVLGKVSNRREAILAVARKT